MVMAIGRSGSILEIPIRNWNIIVSELIFKSNLHIRNTYKELKQEVVTRKATASLKY